ncbi:MAG: hypothetical protein M8353_00455 [ANME-2 cluster archaeon]|nr:hypothetical protein [ANME-2 cluster archaeon]
MRLHEALEEPVAEYKDILAAVEWFSKTKQLHRIVKGSDDPVDGGVEGFGRFHGERDHFVEDPIVEGGIHGPGPV